MSPILGVVASSNQQGRSGGVTGSYDALAYVKLTTATNTVYFANIPSEYRNLEIRCISRLTGGATTSSASLTFNNDATASYSVHEMEAYGNSISYYQATSQYATNIGYMPAVGATAGMYGNTIVTITDYSSANKAKTVLSLIANNQNNAAGQASVWSGAWYKTSPITSLALLADVGNFAVGTSFGLYGVR